MNDQPLLVATTEETYQRVGICATLAKVSPGERTFRLRFFDGDEIDGIVFEGDAHELAAHVGEEMLVGGIAYFRPSGRFVRLEADEFRRAVPTDRFFAKVPHGPGLGTGRPEFRSLKDAIGKWPGDESDEEVARALEELS